MTTPTPRQIYNAASSAEPRAAMVALGLPAPANLGDVWRAMRDAYDAMTDRECACEDNETRVRLNYIAAASKCAVAPRIPQVARYTRDLPTRER